MFILCITPIWLSQLVKANSCNIYVENTLSKSNSTETYHTVEILELSTKIIKSMITLSKVFPVNTGNDILTIDPGNPFCNKLGNSFPLQVASTNITNEQIEAYNIGGKILIQINDNVRIINSELFDTLGDSLSKTIQLNYDEGIHPLYLYKDTVTDIPANAKVTCLLPSIFKTTKTILTNTFDRLKSTLYNIINIEDLIGDKKTSNILECLNLKASWTLNHLSSKTEEELEVCLKKRKRRQVYKPFYINQFKSENKHIENKTVQKHYLGMYKHNCNKNNTVQYSVKLQYKAGNSTVS